jgi:hypothetical protein
VERSFGDSLRFALFEFPKSEPKTHRIDRETSSKHKRHHHFHLRRPPLTGFAYNQSALRQSVPLFYNAMDRGSSPGNQKYLLRTRLYSSPPIPSDRPAKAVIGHACWSHGRHGAVPQCFTVAFRIHNMPRCQTDPIRTGSASPVCSIVAIRKILRPRRVRRAEQCNESESLPARSPRRLFGFGRGRTVLVTQGTPMSNRYWTLLATIASR